MLTKSSLWEFICAYQLFMQHVVLAMVDEVLDSYRRVQSLNH